MLLSIDTTLSAAFAVVDRDGGILAEKSTTFPDAGVAEFGALIKQILSESSTDPATLSGVAVGTGPGSAHQVDAGVAAAHGFAAALGKPVVRVLSHDAAMLDRTTPSVVVSSTPGGGHVWTAYGEPDAELQLPVRLTEPSDLAFDLEGLSAQHGFEFELFGIEEISAGALGMLAERLFAGGRSFARREPYFL